MCEMFVDADVLINLLAAVIHPGCPKGCEQSTGMLDVSRFVVRQRLKRRYDGDPKPALECFEDFLANTRLLQPSQEELAAAVELEEAAARIGAAFDVGESQLCAIAMNRGLPLILTGDKRGIEAAERLLATVSGLGALAARLACLEQAAALAAKRLGALEVRSRVVAQPRMDAALSICFQYTRPDAEVSEDFEPSGLKSYIEHLRKTAPTMLLPGLVLTLESAA